MQEMQKGERGGIDLVQFDLCGILIVCRVITSRVHG